MVGMIGFLVIGVMEVCTLLSTNQPLYLHVIIQNSVPESDDTAVVCQPVYQLQSDVNISSLAITGMKQSSLCVMRESGFEFHSTDSYLVVEDKLRVLFPKLFNWISKSEWDDATTSSWLICMRLPYARKSLIVYSDDQSLPTSFDIFTACQLLNSKVGFQNWVLYLGRFCSFGL